MGTQPPPPRALGRGFGPAPRHRHRPAPWLLLVLPALALLLALSGCDNSPYPRGTAESNTLLNAFQERSPRTLDPTSSYNTNETPYTYQVYEPLYGYPYLATDDYSRLEPRSAAAVVEPRYLDAQRNPLPADADPARIAFSVYDIPIRQGVHFAPHPAFARDEAGRYRYHALQAGDVGDRRSPLEFEHRDTRELTAEDFVYALKRHASPRVEAPVFGVFSEHVLGLKELGATLRQADAELRRGLPASALDRPFLDLRRWNIEGAQAVEPHLLRITLRGKYPQWKYWLAMTFMAPIPWEAEAFYAQPGMVAAGLSLATWPVGTGPYMMTQRITDRLHVMERNPRYRGEPYPCEGTEAHRRAGLLDDCGKTMPFIDRIVSINEREKLPHKAKFVQGYLDLPAIENQTWGIEFLSDMQDSADTAKLYQERGFQFPKTVDLTISYLGFNWLDPVVGRGDTPEQQARNRKLRQAIAIAIDYEEYSRIFPNRAGEAAHAPLPKGLFGSRHGTVEGHNPVTHRVVDGRVLRRPIEDARRLLAEAGYPGGRDAKSGRPLTLYYDFQRVPTPEIRSELDWFTRQIGKLGIQLEIRATDYNQFQEKMRNGRAQLFTWAWHADYPDPENFLFLLYGPNAKVGHDGENAANYANAKFDALYKRMQSLDDGAERQRVIDEMVAILREDVPWAFGVFPYAAAAFQPWVRNGQPSVLAFDRAKYYRLDTQMRAQRWAEWNRPVWWPLLLLPVGLALLAWRLRALWRAREAAAGRSGEPAGAGAAKAPGRAAA
ncbi:ABC transporter substrate-binding protein [Azohydromonas aeria]|uniref:ABC transporter substrate-binding protein n=1 Tax=Azohydromonas aeria TaxID=2590212 RepID=UPI0012F838B8|nr:ABC transporter substrate-binding protein [Azohydromonas aeria]